MLDANMEIDKLRQRLRFKNLNESIIDSICDDVSREIGTTAVDLLANAAEEAVRAGQNSKSIEFINEVRIKQEGVGFAIGTESGKSNFSEPPFPMLPKLLKNGKIAKDGSQYKVIPIRAKGNKSNGGRLATTTEAALKGINEARQAAKQERDAMKEKLNTSLSPDAMKGMSTFAALQTINNARKSFPTMTQKSTEPVVAFRTASSKQDATAKWVHPGRDANMDTVLHDINARLQYDLDNIIEDTIRRHEGMY